MEYKKKQQEFKRRLLLQVKTIWDSSTKGTYITPKPEFCGGNYTELEDLESCQTIKNK